jgi:precorrin-6B methylase 2
MLDLKPGETIYDIGCGDARILIEAAEKFNARGIGIEVHPIRADIAKYTVKANGLKDRIEIIETDALEADISQADAVYMYLTPTGLDKIESKLKRQLKPSCRVVSKDYRIREWKHVEKKHFLGHYFYLYRMDAI